MTEPRDDSSCLDAETIAAWLDGGLPDAERAAVEAHAAACEHCRALAATIVRNQAAGPDVLPVPAGEPRTRSRWPWMAPLAVAAILALAIWVPRRGALPAPESTVAVAPLPRAAPPPDAELSALEPQPEPRSAPSEPQTERKALAEPTAPAAAPFLAAPTAVGQPQAPPPQPTPAAAPPPPPPPAPVVAEPTVRTLGAPVGAPLGGAAGGPDGVIAEFESPAPVPVQAFSGVAAGGAAGRGGAAARGAGGGGRGAGALASGSTPAASAVAASFSTPPPDPSQPTRWRVLATGAFERSSPAGAPWERIEIEPPGLRIVAGDAPNSSICWLVGRGGAVLLSLDAQVFRRLSFPEAVDLVSVRATSGRMASVRTSDGRTFTTMDGGQTWLRD